MESAEKAGMQTTEPETGGPETDYRNVTDEAREIEQSLETEGEDDPYQRSIERAREAANQVAQRRANARLNPSDYVNGMYNKGLIAGKVIAKDKTTILIAQNSNPEHFIPVQIDPTRFSAKQIASRPRTVRFHVRGMVNEHGPQAVLKLFEFEEPKAGSMSNTAVFLSAVPPELLNKKALALLSKPNFNPFGKNGLILPEFIPYLSTEYIEQAMKAKEAGEAPPERKLNDMAENILRVYELYEMTNSPNALRITDSQLNRSQNRVTLAGFIEAAVYIPKDEYRTEGYGLVLLRQHEDPSLSIPIRVRAGPFKRMANAGVLYEGRHIKAAGSVRRKVIPNDDGSIKSWHVFVELESSFTDAQLMTDIVKMPLWVKEMAERNAEKKRAAEARKAALLLQAETEERVYSALSDAARKERELSKSLSAAAVDFDGDIS